MLKYTSRFSVNLLTWQRMDKQHQAASCIRFHSEPAAAMLPSVNQLHKHRKRPQEQAKNNVIVKN